ncbi:MAG: hypothetical protein AB1439_00510 [candidate division FCPU426 bacterium]
MLSLIKRYGLYLLRWQLSTPILAACLIYFRPLGSLWATVLANLAGGLVFFWVDRFIFTHHCLGNLWEVEEQVRCADCGSVERGYRLVCADSGRYDKRQDPKPEFRCQRCSEKKRQALAAAGKI